MDNDELTRALLVMMHDVDKMRRVAARVETQVIALAGRHGLRVAAGDPRQGSDFAHDVPQKVGDGAVILDFRPRGE
jgi:hypothetical protein